MTDGFPTKKASNADKISSYQGPIIQISHMEWIPIHQWQVDIDITIKQFQFLSYTASYTMKNGIAHGHCKGLLAFIAFFRVKNMAGHEARFYGSIWDELTMEL